MNAVVARWDGFLMQVQGRFATIMREAQEGCPLLLAQADFDPVPMGNAWGAMEMRARQLDTKIEETWSGQVEGAFERAGATPDALAYERAKGDAMRAHLDVERERTRIGIFADAGRAFFERARVEIGRGFACQRCGAPLEVPFTFRALNVTCPHCTTVNGFEPGTRMRMGETYIHQLCEEAAWAEWVTMRQAESVWRRSRGASKELLKVWERAKLAFWRAYLTARIRLLPDTAGAFEADLAGRMRSR